MTKLEKMGLAAELPGRVRAIEDQQAEVDKIRAILAEADEEPAKKKRPRASAYWASMSAAERSAEVKRRRAKGGISTVGLKRGTAAYRAADAQMHREIRAAKKAAAKPKLNSAQTGWDRMSVRQRKARLAAMAAGKLAKKSHVNGEAVA